MARLLTVFLAVSLILGQAGIALAAPASGFRGLSLSTPYPAQTVRAGERVTLTLTVKNFGLSPQAVALRVAEVPRGWKAAILGGGRPVAAVYAEPDQEIAVSLQLDPPAGAGTGSFRFLVVAQGQTATAQLPLTLTVGPVLPPRPPPPPPPRAGPPRPRPPPPPPTHYNPVEKTRGGAAPRDVELSASE